MDIQSIKKTLEEEIKSISDAAQLEELKTKYLGRKGILTSITSVIPTLPVDQRAAFGKSVNELKNYITQVFEEKQKSVGIYWGS